MILARILQAPLRFWHRFLAPAFPPMCRFYPSCSVYAIEALERHGLGKAMWLIVKRIAKCQPFSRGGFDPVPGSHGDEAASAECCGSHHERDRA